MLVTRSLILPVTDDGVAIPKEWLGDAVEVVVRSENGRVIVQLVEAHSVGDAAQAPASESQGSIWSIGSDPITDDPITDGSVNHDRYLYGPKQ